MKKDTALEIRISLFLRYGVIFAGTLLLLGWIFNFRFYGNPFFNFQVYDRIPFTELISFYWNKKDWGILLSYAGLISLITLPLIRVALLSFLFLRQKELPLAVISALVIILLLISISLGLQL
jgi:uncharacterized membrane protein